MNNKGNALIVAILASISLVLITAFVYIRYINPKPIDPDYQLLPKPSYTPTPISTIEVKGEIGKDDTDPMKIYFYRNKDRLAAFNRYDYQIIMWENAGKNYLIYGEGEDEKLGPSGNIMILDISSGEKRILVDKAAIFKEVADGRGGLDSTTLHYMTLIGNKLYGSYTGYLASGVTFYVDLTKIDPAVGLKDVGSTFSIEKIGNDYWFTSGFGDGCGGTSIYIRYNIETRKASDSFKIDSACDVGDSLIGFKPEKDMVLIGKYVRDGTTNYTQIYYLKLSDPKKSVTLLDKDSMPKFVTTLLFDKARNRVLMLHTDTSISTLDLNTNKVELEVGHYDPNLANAYFEDADDSYVCTFSGGTYTKLSLKDFTTSEDGDFCTSKVSSDGTEKEIRDYFSKLNLPTEYQIRFAPRPN